DLKPYLQFVPVQNDDYFEIEPGMVHAIGAGVTILEPQRVVPGMSGKTFRFWDWGRLYDKTGHPTPQGEPRVLHWQEALAIVDPGAQVGPAFIKSTKRNAAVMADDDAKYWQAYPKNNYYQVHFIRLHKGRSA